MNGVPIETGWWCDEEGFFISESQYEDGDIDHCANCGSSRGRTATVIESGAE